MASLVDTNILVYRVDPRDTFKQDVALRLLREGIDGGQLYIAHQCVVEFVAAVTRPLKALNGRPLLERRVALREAESLMAQFTALYPDRDTLRTAIRGAATYGLSWFDANLWACAEVNGMAEILSEDFQHGRHYGGVRVLNPFLAARGGVAELPPLYTARQGPAAR